MNYREFADWAKSAAVAIGGDFTKPDDDWLPTALLEGVVVGLAFPKQH